jgi:hypothetical protein
MCYQCVYTTEAAVKLINRAYKATIADGVFRAGGYMFIRVCPRIPGQGNQIHRHALAERYKTAFSKQPWPFVVATLQVSMRCMFSPVDQCRSILAGNLRAGCLRDKLEFSTRTLIETINTQSRGVPNSPCSFCVLQDQDETSALTADFVGNIHTAPWARRGNAMFVSVINASSPRDLRLHGRPPHLLSTSKALDGFKAL